MNKIIYVTLSTFAEYSQTPIDLLEKSGFPYKINSSGKRMTPAEVIELAGSSSGLIAGVEQYSEETLDQLPSLKCISRVGVGIDNIDLAACKKKGISVLNTPDEPIIAVAELTVGCILSLLRKLNTLTELTKSRQWKRIPGNLLQGKLVGIIGLGRIGKRVAGLLQCFGARIIAYDPVVDNKWAQENNVAYVEFETLLQDADIICLHASGSNDKFKIGRAEFNTMKQGALLVNMARGGMVDDVELAKMLASGKIGGAALDVYPQEPYTGPLCDSDQVVLTPHEATLTIETRVAMETLAVENLINYLNNNSK